MSTTATTITVKSSELLEGDVVLCHGMRCLIDGSVESHDRGDTRVFHYRALVTNIDEVDDAWLVNRTRELGPWPTHTPTGEHRWTIQGNDLVRWTVERNELAGESDFELLERETRLEALIAQRLEVDYYGGGENPDDGEHEALETVRAEQRRRAAAGITVSKDTDPSMADLEPYGREWELEQAERMEA